MPQTVTVDHFDTCLSDYVANHMNGDREALLSVVVTNETTFAEVKAELESQLRNEEFYGKLDLPSVEDLLIGLEDAFSTVSDMGSTAVPSLDPIDEDDDMAESPSMWFRLSWEAPEPSEGIQIAEVMGAYDISDADWDATPASVQAALLQAHADAG